MKIIKSIFLGFFFLSLIYGCSEDFYFKELKPKDFGAKSELYVQVYAEADSVYEVRLSKTVPSLGAPDNFDQYVDNAKVYLKDENGEVEIPFFENSKKKDAGFSFFINYGECSIYKLNSKKFKFNQKYEIEIYYNGKTYLESVTTPIQKPNYTIKLDSAKEYNKDYDRIETKYFAEVNIEPMVNDDNYYLVEVYQVLTYTFKTETSLHFVDLEENTSARIPYFFTNTSSLNSEGRIQKKRTIFINYPNGSNRDSLNFIINVAKVEKALYDYAASLEQNFYNQGGAFSEPTQLKWNLKNAKGIACGIAHSPKNITVKLK